MSTPENLAAALAAVQAQLPTVGKDHTATVEKRSGGSYKYSYADLAAVSKAILPLLGANGLSWITRPTINDAGKFVLAYELLHVSGESRVGEYPLTGGTPQEIGSAITYARRYTLCSVTGVAPEQDDDDAAAASNRQPARDQWDDAKPARQRTPSPAEVRSQIAQVGAGRGLTPAGIAEDFAAWTKGVVIGECDDVRLLGDYRDKLRALPVPTPVDLPASAHDRDAYAPKDGES